MFSVLREQLEENLMMISFSLDFWFKNRDVETQEHYKSRWRSIWIMYLTMFLSSVGE